MRIGKGTWYSDPGRWYEREDPIGTPIAPILGDGKYYICIDISSCKEGIYLRWWYNGWHYFLFQNGYEVTMRSESMGTQVTRMFSVISKIERPTKIKAEYSYRVTMEGITPQNIAGFTGLLMAERVEQYEEIGDTDNYWREVKITRGEHLIKNAGDDSYIFGFEITRKELPLTSTVIQKSILLYLGTTLCDLDDDEVVPINKQVNDIAEMQDRQSDFTAQFRIRKTRTMRALFELSGEVGANTTFPYKTQSCRLIQNGIEMITNGIMILDKVDDQYYYVSILSGNKNFFNTIANLKLTDIAPLSSPDPLDHDWDIDTIKVTHDASPETDYLYPLCEPSDDSAMNPLRLAGNTTELYGGWIWPFVKVETLWDEIFSNAGFTCDDDVLLNSSFSELFMPITDLKITKGYTDRYLYSVWWVGSYDAPATSLLGFTGAVLINGDENFRTGFYYLPFTGTYKIRVSVTVSAGVPTLAVWRGGINTGNMDVISSTPVYIGIATTYEYTISGTLGEIVTIYSTAAYYYYYNESIVEITNPTTDYGSTIIPRDHLPDLSQIDFIKLICNMYGLIPDVNARDRKIKFWNYSDLYDNMAIARDWSAYLSERDDEVEFKFGDYAQNNYLKYKESEDVIIDNGKGIMQIDDETLPSGKDVIELPLSTCDEVTLAFTAPTVNVSRINFNKWYDNTGTWKQSESIDARIVYIKRATGKTFKVWDTVAMNANSVTITDPKIATSIDISFSNLVVDYSFGYRSLSRLLTKTNLRRAKFNLPVYEVAGLKHYIPIYLSQYKAYFYINKINNYVPGQLCIVDLIKL